MHTFKGKVICLILQTQNMKLLEGLRVSESLRSLEPPACTFSATAPPLGRVREEARAGWCPSGSQGPWARLPVGLMYSCPTLLPPQPP